MPAYTCGAETPNPLFAPMGCAVLATLALFSFALSSASAQVITTVGTNVGIGTTSPTHKLEVNGTFSASNVGPSGANTILKTDNAGYLLLDNWIRGTGIYHANGDHAFLDNANFFQTRTPAGLVVAQRDGTRRGNVYFDGAENFGLLNKNGNWAFRSTTSTTEAYGSFYAQHLVDSNNTTYVLDPNGNSRLASVTPNILSSPFAGSDSGISGAQNYAWGYQEAGPWTHPYPDLVIGYHTGMKFGANVGYGGVRFYSDHPSVSSTIIFSVGNGDSHVRVANNLYVSGETQSATFRSTSSARWKEGIETMSNALELVSRLRAVTYRWKSDTPLAGQKDIGFTAEEVDAVLPEVVGRDSEGKAASIDYSRISALLVAAVKEVDQKQLATAREFHAMRLQMAALEQQSSAFERLRGWFFIILTIAVAIGFTVGRRWRRN